MKSGWIYSRPYVYFEGLFHEPQESWVDDINRNFPKLTGMFYDIAQSMSQHCNFSMKLERLNEFGVRRNDGTWNGMVGMLRNHELDIGIADITPTTERSKVADFSIGLRSSDFILLQATSNKNTFNWEIYKNVFSDYFWICLFISVLSLTTCLFLVQFCIIGRYATVQCRKTNMK